MGERKIAREQIEEAAELREKGWSFGRLAARYGISRGAMSWHMLCEGADPANLRTKVLPQTWPGPARCLRGDVLVRRFSAAEDEAILAAEAQGRTYTDIGRALNPPRKPNSVRGRLLTLARHEARREAASAR